MSHGELLGWIAIALYIQAWLIILFVTWRIRAHVNRLDAQIKGQAERLAARIDRLGTPSVVTRMGSYQGQSRALP